MPSGIYTRTKPGYWENKIGYWKNKKLSKEHKRKIKENHSKVWLGKKHSEETKKKISEMNKGRKLSEETRNKMKGNKNCLGYKHSKESRKKASESHKKRVRDGQCHLYKGEISFLLEKIRKGIEYRLWREAVFARDNWICQKCLVKGGELHPHHIRNFAEEKDLRFAIDNGITFCRYCHKLFHKKYWNRNNSREQLEEFLKND